MNLPADSVPARLGVFGGVFDPVHRGHVQVAESALTEFALDSVLFIPAGQPPHKGRAAASAKHRVRMLEIALRNEPRFSLSLIELSKPETSFSVHTLEELHRAYPQAELFFIIGLDAFLDLETWYRPRHVLELAHLVVVFRPPWKDEALLQSSFIRPGTSSRISSRSGVTSAITEMRSVVDSRIYFLQGPRCDLSSSRIRALLAAGENVEGLLPEGVQSYILSNKLYEVR